MISKTTPPARKQTTINVATTMSAGDDLLRGTLVHQPENRRGNGPDRTAQHDADRHPPRRSTQPRSTIIEGPKLTIMAKPTVHAPDRPAAITADASCAIKRRFVVHEVPVDSSGGRYRVAE